MLHYCYDRYVYNRLAYRDFNIICILLDYGGLNYSSLTSSTTGNKKANSQTNSEHNKGEYSLWSDANSFSESYQYNMYSCGSNYVHRYCNDIEKSV